MLAVKSFTLRTLFAKLDWIVSNLSMHVLLRITDSIPNNRDPIALPFQAASARLVWSGPYFENDWQTPLYLLYRVTQKKCPTLTVSSGISQQMKTTFCKSGTFFLCHPVFIDLSTRLSSAVVRHSLKNITSTFSDFAYLPRSDTTASLRPL